MKKINHYINSVFYTEDPVLEDVLQSISDNGMRNISVSPATGKTLTMLVKMSGANNILEIGALGGYSGICLARGFEDNGQLTSLELNEEYANLAYRNLSKAGFANQVTYMTGPALESLEELIQNNQTFDFFFVDADKENYENYLNCCIKLAQDNAVIVCDNVLARGSVADETMEAIRHTESMKKFNQTIASHPMLESTLLPIGDGLTVSVVKK